MRYVIVLFVIQLFFSACINKYQGTELSVLTINDRPQNRYIVNRIPDYGDGRRNGCLVLREMRLDLIVTKKQLVSGVVSDITSKTPLPGASITIAAPAQGGLKIMSNQEGRFTMDIPQQVNSIEINYLGYRSVVINF